jgi:hypothetical protein
MLVYVGGTWLNYVQVEAGLDFFKESAEELKKVPEL